jgi:hypothetical protein
MFLFFGVCGIGLLVCLMSALTSETVNSFRQFGNYSIARTLPTQDIRNAKKEDIHCFFGWDSKPQLQDSIGQRQDFSLAEV